MSSLRFSHSVSDLSARVGPGVWPEERRPMDLAWRGHDLTYMCRIAHQKIRRETIRETNLMRWARPKC